VRVRVPGRCVDASYVAERWCAHVLVFCSDGDRTCGVAVKGCGVQFPESRSLVLVEWTPWLRLATVTRALFSTVEFCDAQRRQKVLDGLILSAKVNKGKENTFLNLLQGLIFS
jgi:hypothetical protein